MKFMINAAVSALFWSGPVAGAQAHHQHAMEKLGAVSFPTSCSPAVQPQFDTAVALMHSFQFGRAIDGFNAVLKSDPTCAIADWGIALSAWSNPFAGFKFPAQLAQGWEAVRKARLTGARTARERAYIDAVAKLYEPGPEVQPAQRLIAYEKAMERVSVRFPRDVEATIFYALALAASADPEDKSYAKQRRAGALLKPLFARFPDHPGLAHYIIHAYDEPALAAQAEQAARRYGAIAPSTPHALHMPSHTFTRVGDWQASIDTNKASAAAAMRAGQPADVLHASDYMIYAYLQTGQDEKAREIVQRSAGIFQTFNPANATGAAPASAAYYANAAIPARYILERHAWGEAAALPSPSSPFANADAITEFTRGLAATYLKDSASARAALAALARLKGRLAQTHDDYWAGQVHIAEREVAARLAFSEGNTETALSGLREAARLESATELASVTPGPLVPAHELLGDLLLETNRPAEALSEYRVSLEGNPKRFWSLTGAARAAASSGDARAAGKYASELLQITANADRPGRPERVEMQRISAK